MMAAKPRTIYTITPRVPVICATCNEDITRAQGGDEPTTIAEARQAIREHNETWHPGTVPEVSTER